MHEGGRGEADQRQLAVEHWLSSDEVPYDLQRNKEGNSALHVAIAQNQVAQAIALEEKGAAVYVGDYSTESKRLEKIQQRVVNVLENLRCSPDTLKTMSQSALSIMEAYNHNQPWVDEIIK